MSDSPKEDSAQNLAESFEALGLRPGAPMQLQPMGGGDQEYYAVKFIGAIKGKSLLLTVPLVRGEKLWMRTGQSFIIRGFTGKHAYALIVKVILARSNPFGYVHFSYPRLVQSRVVRKSHRVALDLSAKASLEGGASFPATIRDLSTCGAMLDSPTSLGEIDSRINLAFPVAFEDFQTDINVPARIKKIYDSKSDGNVRAGVEFEKISQNDSLILHYFVHSAGESAT